MRSCSTRDEELATIGIFPVVGHAQQSRCVVFDGEILVRKFTAIYTFRTGAVVVDKITALDHKFFNDTMKNGAFVPQWKTTWFVFTAAQLTKVLGGLGRGCLVQFHFNTTHRRAAHGHVKKTNNVSSFKGSRYVGVGGYKGGGSGVGHCCNYWSVDISRGDLLRGEVK